MFELSSCLVAGHTQAIDRKGTSCDDPKLVEVLRNERKNMSIDSQEPKRIDGFCMLRIFGVDPPSEDIRIEKNIHRPRPP